GRPVMLVLAGDQRRAATGHRRRDRSGRADADHAVLGRMRGLAPCARDDGKQCHAAEENEPEDENQVDEQGGHDGVPFPGRTGPRATLCRLVPSLFHVPVFWFAMIGAEWPTIVRGTGAGTVSSASGAPGQPPGVFGYESYVRKCVATMSQPA